MDDGMVMDDDGGGGGMVMSFVSWDSYKTTILVRHICALICLFFFH